MTLDEQRWQKKLARKRKGQNGKRPLPTRSQLHSPASVAHRPIHDSLVAKNLFETGVGMAALARALPTATWRWPLWRDVHRLGVEDAFYRVVSPDQFAEFVQRFDFDHIHPRPAQARGGRRRLCPRSRLPTASRLHWCRCALRGPPRRPRVPCATPYGKEGKPLYVSGPDEALAQSQRIMEALTRRLGPEGVPLRYGGRYPRGDICAGSSEPVTLYSYEITEEPTPDAAFDRLPAEGQERINGLYEKVQATTKTGLG